MLPRAFMKKNLIPLYVHEKLKEREQKGTFSAFVVSGDIANFTPRVETLMKQGKSGAETIGTLLNDTFGRITDIVYANGGFITNFAGDAFTAIFEQENNGSSALHVINLCNAVNDIFNETHIQEKAKNISIRMGVSYGKVSFQMLKGHFMSYYFRGPGIDKAVKIQQKAKPGIPCFDNSVAKYIDKRNYTGTALCNAKPGLPKVHISKKSSLRFSNINCRFYPDILDELVISGEFRRVIPVFICFPPNLKVSEIECITQKVMTLSSDMKGYFNKIDFGDKGGVILIIFGAPYASENMIENALQFSLTVSKELGNFNLRIGMDYGITYAGFIGSKIWSEYTALGDVVNTASRLSTEAEGRVNISERLIEHTDDFTFNEAGSLVLKGKSESIRFYEAAPKSKSFDFDFISPFVGREEELSNIKLSLEKSDSKIPLNILIQGESGVGKTRLVMESVRRTSLKALHTAGDPIIKESLYPVKQLFAGIMGFNVHENDSKKTEAISAYMKEHFPDNAGTYIPLLLSFFSIQGMKDDSSLSAKEKLEAIFFILKQSLALECAENTVIIIDDAMWLDEDSIEFIRYIIRDRDMSHLKFFTLFREENEITKKLLSLHMNSIRMSVNSFTFEGVREFTTVFFKKDVSDDLIKKLWDKSEGNPLFLEQITLHLVDNDLISISDNKISLKDDNYDMPANINRLIVSRLDNLSGITRDGIQKASVIGKEFEIKLLEYLVGNKRIKNIINEGERNKIISVLAKQLGMFRHTLLYEIAYKMQFDGSLKKLHKKIAALYENIYSENLYPYYETLYYHYSKAGVKNKTIDYLQKSVDKEIEAYSNESALSFIVKLLDLKIPSSRKAEAHIKAGTVLSQLSRYDEAVKHYKEALKSSSRDRSKQADAYKGTGKVMWSMGKYSEALTHFKKAFLIYRKLRDRKGMSEIYEQTGLVYYNKGEYKDSVEQFNKALEKADNKEQENSILSNLGLVLFRQGEFSQAMKYYTKALKDAERNKNLNNQGILHLRIGLVFWETEKHDEALKHYNTALDINRKIGNLRMEAIVLGNIGNIYDNLKESDTALKYYFEALRIDKEINNLDNETIILGNIANIYGSREEYGKSLEYYMQALDIDREIGNRWSEAIDLGNIGELYKRQKKFTEADKYFSMCIDIVRAMNARYPLSHFLYHRGELLFQMKDYDGAYALAEESAEIAGEINKETLVEAANDLIKRLNKKKERKGN